MAVGDPRPPLRFSASLFGVGDGDGRQNRGGADSLNGSMHNQKQQPKIPWIVLLFATDVEIRKHTNKASSLHRYICIRDPQYLQLPENSYACGLPARRMVQAAHANHHLDIV